MASSDDEPPRARGKIAIQISAACMERLDQAAEATGLTRPRIIEHLIERIPPRELIRLLKAEKPQPSRSGRPKLSIFRPRPKVGQRVGESDD